MKSKMNPDFEAECRSIYQIKLQGFLNERWSDWLGDAAFHYERGGDDPNTFLIVAIADQAALRGILNKLWDLNLTLLSVSQIEADSAA